MSRAIARATASSNTCASTGFVRRSAASAFIARTHAISRLTAALCRGREAEKESPRERENRNDGLTGVLMEWVFDLVAIRHRRPAVVRGAAEIKALRCSDRRGCRLFAREESIGTRWLEAAPLIALRDVLGDAITVDVRADPVDMQKPVIGAVRNHAAKL